MRLPSGVPGVHTVAMAPARHTPHPEQQLLQQQQKQHHHPPWSIRQQLVTELGSPVGDGSADWDVEAFLHRLQCSGVLDSLRTSASQAHARRRSLVIAKEALLDHHQKQQRRLQPLPPKEQDPPAPLFLSDEAQSESEEDGEGWAIGSNTEDGGSTVSTPDDSDWMSDRSDSLPSDSAISSPPPAPDSASAASIASAPSSTPSSIERWGLKRLVSSACSRRGNSAASDPAACAGSTAEGLAGNLSVSGKRLSGRKGEGEAGAVDRPSALTRDSASIGVDLNGSLCASGDAEDAASTPACSVTDADLLEFVRELEATGHGEGASGTDGANASSSCATAAAATTAVACMAVEVAVRQESGQASRVATPTPLHAGKKDKNKDKDKEKEAHAVRDRRGRKGKTEPAASAAAAAAGRWRLVMRRSTPTVEYVSWVRERSKSDGCGGAGAGSRSGLGIGCPEYRGQMIVQGCSAEAVRDFLLDELHRTEWDDAREESGMLEEWDEDGRSVARWVRRLPFFLRNREYVVARKVWNPRPNTFYCISRHAMHPAAPIKNNPIRVSAVYSAWRVRPYPRSTVAPPSSAVGVLDPKKQQGKGAGPVPLQPPPTQQLCSEQVIEIVTQYAEESGLQRDLVRMGVAHGMWGHIVRMEKALHQYIARKKNMRHLLPRFLIQTDRCAEVAAEGAVPSAVAHPVAGLVAGLPADERGHGENLALMSSSALICASQGENGTAQPASLPVPTPTPDACPDGIVAEEEGEEVFHDAVTNLEL